MLSKELEDQQDVVTFISSQWDLKVPFKVEDFTKGGYYGGVLKIIYGDNDYACKSYPKTSRQLLEFISGVFSYLSMQDFSNFPELIPAIDGSKFTQGPGGSFYTLTPWIDGTTVSDKDPYNVNRERVRSLAKVIAQFHKKTRELPKNESFIKDEKISELWAPELVERHTHVASLANTNSNPFGKWGLSYEINNLLNATKPLINLLKDQGKLDYLDQLFTKGIVHSDLWIGHWLFDSSGKPYIIDFNRLRYGRLVDDVERIVSESMRIDRRYGSIALTEYLSQNPLPEDEIHQLPFLSQYGIVRRTFWLIDQFLKKGGVLKSGPLNLPMEIKRATEVMGTNIDSIL